MSAATEIDLDALERAAREADREPWQQVGREVHSAFNDGANRKVGRFAYPADASFCAAANPAVVLDLVRRLRAAEAVVDLYEAAHEDLFVQCCSNPISNAWGKQVSVAKLNEAHLAVLRLRRKF